MVAIVEFPEQTGLRLTSNLVNCPIEEIRIGMAVRVVFRHTRMSGATCGCRSSSPTPTAASDETGANRTEKNLAEKQCAISGIGQSDVGRRLGRDPLELTLDACYAAIADAGLTPADIDGLSTYPGGMAGPRGSPALPPTR